MQATKAFFTQAFGWSFQDFGPEYTAFSKQGIDGGFFKAELRSATGNGAAMIIFYSQDIEATQDKIEKANGKNHKTDFLLSRSQTVFTLWNQVATSSPCGRTKKPINSVNFTCQIYNRLAPFNRPASGLCYWLQRISSCIK